MANETTDLESKSTMTLVQEVRSSSIPDDAHVMTVLINHPPGAPGYPPHRLPGGPGFGCCSPAAAGPLRSRGAEPESTCGTSQ